MHKCTSPYFQHFELKAFFTFKDWLNRCPYICLKFTLICSLTGLILTLAELGENGLTVSKSSLVTIEKDLNLLNNIRNVNVVFPIYSLFNIVFMKSDGLFDCTITKFLEEQVQTWGPSSLQDLAQAMHTFLPSGWMEYTHCFGAGKDSCALTGSSSPILLLEDELIKISAVLLHSETNPHHTAESVSLEEINDGVTSTVYICELSTVPGKFDPDKAQAKGLKPGYKYGRLQNGESVMSDDGTIMVIFSIYSKV